MIQELLEKYRNQEPKKFGEHHQEKCYPVSAVIEMIEIALKQGQNLPLADVVGSKKVSIIDNLKCLLGVHKYRVYEKSGSVYGFREFKNCQNCGICK